MPRIYRIDTVRIPETLAIKIKREAERNRNTFNGELISRLQQSFENGSARSIEDAVALLTKTVRKQLPAE